MFGSNLGVLIGKLVAHIMQVRQRQYILTRKVSLLLCTMHDIDDSVVPGSVYLVDVQEKSTVVHAQTDSAIVLSPTPSNDINDPLNWSRGRKLLQIICVMICVSQHSTESDVSDIYSVYRHKCNWH